jgi:hypothetical protein
MREGNWPEAFSQTEVNPDFFVYRRRDREEILPDEFVNERSHINGIESFWAFAKTRLAKFRGMSKSTFYLHLKESEFRFNYRGLNLYDLMLKIIRKNTLF